MLRVMIMCVCQPLQCLLVTWICLPPFKLLLMTNRHKLRNILTYLGFQSSKARSFRHYRVWNLALELEQCYGALVIPGVQKVLQLGYTGSFALWAALKSSPLAMRWNGGACLWEYHVCHHLEFTRFWIMCKIVEKANIEFRSASLCIFRSILNLLLAFLLSNVTHVAT